ncbi:MAG TPA: hypothetical protein VGC66_20105 [Pyrinomonadaceae bacterium]|jgi:hypothetical protein
MSTPITRSPRHPQVGLGEAIERIRLIYKKEHNHVADKEVVANDMNYAGINGASLGMIATLKQYGLLETVDDGLKVTEDAITILELPEDDSEKIEAMWKAALAPKLFSELYETYGDKLPSDDNLRLSLMRRGFSKKAAEVAVRAYRETIRLVQDTQSFYNAARESVEKRQAAPKGTTMQQQPPPSTTNANPLADFFGAPKTNVQPASPDERAQVFQISKDAEARIVFRGQVTQEAIEKLCAILQLAKDIYPTKDELSPPSKNVAPEPIKVETTASAEQPRRLDETIPGGRYQTADGRFVNANGEEIE